MLNDYKQIIVADRQTLTDIAIQEYGCAEGLRYLLEDNSDRILDISDVPSAGMVMNIRAQVPRITSNNQAVAAAFSKRKSTIISGAIQVTNVIETLTNYVDADYVDGGYVAPRRATQMITTNLRVSDLWL